MTDDISSSPEIPVPAGWPAPSSEDAARHRALTALIRDDIADAGGAIPFGRFMELALYAPALGYYSSTQPKFGERGDFITAPEVSPLFGRCVARQVAQLLGVLGHGDILEAGAGSGALAAELLLALEHAGQLPQHYFILELSAGLHSLQHETISQRAPHLLPRVQWLNELPEYGFRGVVLGNELLDAMPVARFRITDTGIVEEYVCWQGNRFSACERPASAAFASKVGALGLEAGYVSELGLHADAWIRSIAPMLDQGVILLADYGFPRAEFYHPQRAQGTLMCHYRHRAHSDPFMLVGLQDITAHIDFTAIAEAAHGAELDVLGYTSQAAFLIGCGITEMAIETTDVRAQMKISQAVNKLTAPQEMGELFKVIALGRGVQGPLRGFVVQDRRSRL